MDKQSMNSSSASSGYLNQDSYSPRVLVIGVSGGIGSGKSSFSQILLEISKAFANDDKMKLNKVTLIDADKVGHSIYKPGSKVIQTLREHFGEKIINQNDGTLNRAALGPIVFSNPAELAYLNSITWPAIQSEIENEIAKISNDSIKNKEQGIHAVIVEAAVLLEAKWDSIVDEVWTVVVPVEKAVERLKIRNNFSEEEALKRIKSQMTNEERIQRSHLVINNDKSLEDLKEKASEVLYKLFSRYSGITAFELVDVVDKDTNKVIGKPKKRGTIRSYNLPHRATYCIIEQKLDGLRAFEIFWDSQNTEDSSNSKKPRM